MIQDRSLHVSFASWGETLRGEENMGLMGKKGGCNQYKEFIFDPMLWMEKHKCCRRGVEELLRVGKNHYLRNR